MLCVWKEANCILWWTELQGCNSKCSTVHPEWRDGSHESPAWLPKNKGSKGCTLLSVSHREWIRCTMVARRVGLGHLSNTTILSKNFRSLQALWGTGSCLILFLSISLFLSLSLSFSLSLSLSLLPSQRPFVHSTPLLLFLFCSIHLPFPLLFDLPKG